MTIARLEAWCDYETEDEYRAELARSSLPPAARAEALEEFKRQSSFRIQEYAVLDDGRRLALGPEKGFSSTAFETTEGGPTVRLDPWEDTTLESIESGVRCTVLPDEDPTDDEHPWEWLADRLRDHGIEVSPAELKQVPYEVVFSERLRARAS